MGISEFQYQQMLARTSAGMGRQPIRKAPESVEREAELHEQIEAYCKSKGWLAVHSRMDRATTQAPGVTDFIIFTPFNVFCIECKVQGRKPRAEQLAFGAAVKKLQWPHSFVYSFEEFTTFVHDPKWNLTSHCHAANAEPPLQSSPP